MDRRRLDNGRCSSAMFSSETNSAQGEANQLHVVACPQAPPLTLELLLSLLITHNWSSYRDENGEITAIHVETKEGHDRFKYILGVDGSSNEIVLLSKQHILRAGFGPFVTLEVKFELVTKPVAVLLKQEPQTLFRSAKAIACRDRRPQEATRAILITNKTLNSATTALKSETARFEGVKRDRSSSHSDTVGSSKDDLLPSPETTEEAPNPPLLSIPTTSKRKRPPPGSYMIPRPPDLRKRRRVAEPIPGEEDVEINSDTASNDHTPMRTMAKDEGAIALYVDGLDRFDVDTSSDEDENPHYVSGATTIGSKRVRIEDWVASSL